MLNFDQLVREVGEWSENNFGWQETKHLTIPWQTDGCSYTTTLAHPVNLNSICPLMGIVEEIGELYEGGTEPEIKDSIGDAVIFSCDFCFRERTILHIGHNNLAEEIRVDIEPDRALVIYVARLLRTVLKRHQGIRGMDNDESYRKARDLNMYHFIHQLSRFVKQTFPKTSLLQIANETWNDIVKKRDWKKNKETGEVSENDKPELVIQRKVEDLDPETQERVNELMEDRPNEG